MRRRTFLKLMGYASVAAGLAVVGPVAASSPRSDPAAAMPSAGRSPRLYRGRGGRIFTSSNAGRSWKLHTYLGPEYDVTHVRTDEAGGTAARIAYRGRSFNLSLAPDLRSWLTD